MIRNNFMNFYYWIKNKYLGYSYRLENLEEVFVDKADEIRKQVEEFGKYEDKIFVVKGAN
jgi:hypothetical protein